MQRRVLGRLGIAIGVAAAGAALSLSSAASAFADDPGVPISHAPLGAVGPYATYTDCVYAGNSAAQQGLLWGFSCTQRSDGWYYLNPR
ncbi:hypothetical protein GCM10010151_63850 [Actinoallomurus spadix]|uniref:Secreted protein n=1 Tax=Actinoallomurus spadix TaxID=79912 RepID=A0ABN0XJ15_9ACTN